MGSTPYTIVPVPRDIQQSILDRPRATLLTAGGTMACRFEAKGGKKISATDLKRVTEIRRYAGRYLVILSATGFTPDARDFAKQYEDVLLVPEAWTS
ncbi:MAG: hypothetical protein QME66_08325 [Candidatus Eisenbacteria bacterium]|nr:hypothetical protein [Candidatus Eisenbacteria bacterium]